MALGVSEELKIVVKAEVDKATRGLKGVQGAAGGIEKNIKSLGIAALKYLGPAFLAGAVLKAGKAAVMAAAGYEQLKVSLEVLLGSASKADKLFTSLREFAVKTPLQLEQLARSASTLMAFGTASENVVDTLKHLGDLAMGMPDKLNRLVLAYGKVQAKGKATLEELNMFTEAGVPLMAELGKQIGLTGDELFAYITAGKVGFAEVDAAVRSMTTGQGQFAGMLEKQSETLIGLFSTAKDSVTDLAATIGTELLDSIKDVATAFTDFVNGIGSGITGVQALKDSLTGIVSKEREVQALEEQQQFLRAGFRGMAGQQTAGLFAQLGNLITGNDEGFARQRALNQLRSELANVPPAEREAEAQALQVRIDMLKSQIEVEKRLTKEKEKQTDEIVTQVSILGQEGMSNILRIDGTLHTRGQNLNPYVYARGANVSSPKFGLGLPVWGHQKSLSDNIASGMFPPNYLGNEVSTGGGFDYGNLNPVDTDEIDRIKKMAEATKLLGEAIGKTIIDTGIDAFVQFADAIGAGEDALQAFVHSIPGLIGEMTKLVGLQLIEFGIATSQPGLVAAGLGLAFAGAFIGGAARSDAENRASGGGSSSGGGAVVNVEIYGAADAHIEGVAIAAINKVRTGYK